MRLLALPMKWNEVEATGKDTYTVKQNGQPTDEINWLVDAILKALKKS